ncbi:MAG: Maf family protein [Pseudomonadota bacterium]
MTKPRVVLASGSAIRAKILSDAGLTFDIIKPDVDEGAIKDAQSHKPLQDVAMMLAEEKCRAGAALVEDKDAIIIGGDQILECGGKGFDKPRSMTEAFERISTLSGQPHRLINATATMRGGEVVWRHIETPALFMRALTVQEINAYLEEAGEGILSSVGAYQIERCGARLFDRIDGDQFAVQGLALLPLLNFLREADALEF